MEGMEGMENMESRKLPKAFKTFRFGVLLASLLFVACSMPTVVMRGEPFELNKRAVVTTQYGGEFHARTLHVHNDSVVIARERGADIKLSLDKVKTIAEFDRIGGFARGAGNGLIAGAAIGLVIGALSDAECSGENCSSVPGFMVGPIVGAMWVAPLGAFLGAMKGHGQSYRFDTTGAGSRRAAAKQARDSAAASAAVAASAPRTPVSPLHEDARYPSHAERMRRSTASKRASAMEVTEYYYGVDVGTPGLLYRFRSQNLDADILPFDAGFLSVSFGKVFSPTMTGGLRLAAMRGHTEGARLREIALLVESKQALGSQGAFVRGGAGFADYASSLNDLTSSSSGLAAYLGFGQELFTTNSLSATISAEAWAASYSNNSTALALKLLAGLNWK